MTASRSARLPALSEQLFFTRQEAAQVARVSVDVIQAAIASGRLRAKRTSRAKQDGRMKAGEPAGKYLISRAALEAWFDGLEDA